MLTPAQFVELHPDKKLNTDACTATHTDACTHITTRTAICTAKT